MVTGKKCNVSYLEKSRILKKLCDSVSKTCIYYKGKILDPVVSIFNGLLNLMYH